MRYGQIRQFDVANGPGIRTSVFVTGCTHHCVNCFNEEYQDFSAGTEWTEKETQQVITYMQSPRVSGLTLLGGEPMQNTAGLTALVKRVRQCIPDKTIWIYSGFTYERILRDRDKKELLALCDVLVDGPFIDALRDPGLFFRGSANQRIIRIRDSLQRGTITLLWPDGR